MSIWKLKLDQNYTCLVYIYFVLYIMVLYLIINHVQSAIKHTVFFVDLLLPKNIGWKFRCYVI